MFYPPPPKKGDLNPRRTETETAESFSQTRSDKSVSFGSAEGTAENGMRLKPRRVPVIGCGDSRSPAFEGGARVRSGGPSVTPHLTRGVYFYLFIYFSGRRQTDLRA